MRRILLLLAIGLVVAIAPAFGDNWAGKCVEVADGDTIIVMHEEKAEKIRLQGVDCPEGEQEFSSEAKAFTAGLVLNKIVNVEGIATDRFDRTVGKIKVEGRSLERELVSAGLAWWFKKYAPDDTVLKKLQEEAQERKVNIWSLPNPLAPWCFRHPDRYRDECPPPAAGAYHGNVPKKIFHAPGCKAYNCKNCTAEFPTKQAAFEAGYRPCGSCLKALLNEYKSGKAQKSQ